MLEGLDRVNWSELGHAYGSAADVPDLIRALRSSEPEVRRKALHSLYGNIYHQGSRYQASAYAVPFLLELVADPATPDRNKVLRLLTALALGFEETWLPDGVPVADLRRRTARGEELYRTAPAGWTTHEGEDSWDQQLDPEDLERLWDWIALMAYDAVRAGVPRISSLLTDDDAAVRVTAAYALAWFPEEANATLPALARAVTDQDSAVAATAAVAIGLVGATREAELVDPLISAQVDIVRWGAAVAVARLRGQAAGPAVAKELLAWGGGSASKHPEIPFMEGDLGGYAALALGQLGATFSDKAFDALLARLRSVSGDEALTVVVEALRQAFPDGRKPEGVPFKALDDRQRRLVQTLADSPKAWRLDNRLFGNFFGMVGGYGLPEHPDLMRAYITGGPDHGDPFRAEKRHRSGSIFRKFIGR